MAKTPKTPNDELDKFLLRMPDGLRDRIKRVADENNRSMNAEIIATLEDTYPEHAFNIASFMDEWMVPIVKQPLPKMRAKLINDANKSLRDAGMDMKVIEGVTADGSIEVALRMGGINFIVGKALELIAPDEND